MLAPQELRYLYAVAKHDVTGAGRVVELGAFMGGSATALAMGLRDNPSMCSEPSAAAPFAREPMLTYDRFVIDASGEHLGGHPYRRGERSRPLFDVLTRDVASLIDVREGELPADTSAAACAEAYPERDPIELLFIDAAKTWELHEAVLAAFGTYLIPGRSLLVQQDAKHLPCFWILLHMYEQRTSLRLVHDVAGGTLAFRCVRPISLGALSRRADTRAADLHQLWRDVAAYWRDQGSEHAAAVAVLAPAMHALRLGRTRAALRLAECALRDAAAADYRTRADRSVLAAALRRHASKDSTSAAAQADRIAEALGVLPDGQAIESRQAGVHIPCDEHDLRCALFDQVAKRCVDAGLRRIALFGAGQHTESLIERGWDGSTARATLVAVVDDAPTDRAIGAVRVVRSDDVETLRELSVEAFIVSSAVHEDVLTGAARRAATAIGVPVFRAYRLSDADRHAVQPREHIDD